MNNSRAAFLGAIDIMTRNSYVGEELKSKIHRELRALDRIKAREEYFENLHENCIYCRKKCKLFKQNKCFSKSAKEQMECEHFDKNYTSIVR